MVFVIAGFRPQVAEQRHFAGAGCEAANAIAAASQQ